MSDSIPEKRHEAPRVIHSDGMTIIAADPSNRACDKCGTDVISANDAVQLDILLGNADPILSLFASPRHLLPVVVAGEEICAGSPSRAQYLPGQPRDGRGYTYDEAYEAKIRAAFSKMQTL
jgi:hypothetical protein